MKLNVKENTLAHQKCHRSKCKVIKVDSKNGFKTGVKKLFTVAINSPKKQQFLLEYCEKKGHQIKCEQNNSKLHSPESDKCDKSKSISVLQLKAFKLQNRVEDHRKMVHRIKEMYGSLSKAAKCLNVHYRLFGTCVKLQIKVSVTNELKK